MARGLLDGEDKVDAKVRPCSLGSLVEATSVGEAAANRGASPPLASAGGLLGERRGAPFPRVAHGGLLEGSGSFAVRGLGSEGGRGGGGGSLGGEAKVDAKVATCGVGPLGEAKLDAKVASCGVGFLGVPKVSVLAMLRGGLGGAVASDRGKDGGGGGDGADKNGKGDKTGKGEGGGAGGGDGDGDGAGGGWYSDVGGWDEGLGCCCRFNRGFVKELVINVGVANRRAQDRVIREYFEDQRSSFLNSVRFVS